MVATVDGDEVRRKKMDHRKKSDDDHDDGDGPMMMTTGKIKMDRRFLKITRRNLKSDGGRHWMTMDLDHDDGDDDGDRHWMTMMMDRKLKSVGQKMDHRKKSDVGPKNVAGPPYI